MTLTRRQFALAACGLALLPLTAKPARAATHQVTIAGMQFSPASLTIAPGDTVVFTNADGAPHTATAKDSSFDTGKLAKGDSASITFSAAGEFAYYCKVHPMMKATITVG